jgi:hypothetical protein
MYGWRDCSAYGQVESGEFLARAEGAAACRVVSREKEKKKETKRKRKSRWSQFEFQGRISARTQGAGRGQLN